MYFFIIISIIMFFFCLYFYFDNKKQKEKITALEQDIKTILEKKLTPNKEDLISIEKISHPNEKNEKTIEKKEPINTTKPENIIAPSKYTKEKYTARTSSTEYIKPKIAQPTETLLDKTPKNKEQTKWEQNTNLIEPINFDPTEFIKKDKKIINNIKKTTQPTNYLNEISKQLADEIPPQTITLTDYEKEQEEHAIISYQELLSLKEKNNNQIKDDEYFVEELKEFYSLLD